VRAIDPSQLSAAAGEILQALVNRSVHRAQLPLLLLRNLGCGLFPLPAPQQLYPLGGQLLGGADDLKTLDLTHSPRLDRQHVDEADGHVK